MRNYQKSKKMLMLNFDGKAKLKGADMDVKQRERVMLMDVITSRVMWMENKALTSQVWWNQQNR